MAKQKQQPMTPEEFAALQASPEFQAEKARILARLDKLEWIKNQERASGILQRTVASLEKGDHRNFRRRMKRVLALTGMDGTPYGL